MLGLQCADCDLIVTSIEDAEAHENDFDEDDLHGGWDTIRIEP